MTAPLRSLSLAALALAATGAARAENWPQWRGPRIDGISEEKGIVTEWGADKNVVWKTDIPGAGKSSPIIWGDKVFLTTALGEGHERALLCLDAATGKILWQKTVVVSEKLGHIHEENSHASSTAATDGEGVFTSFYDDGEANLQRLDFEGNKVWEARPAHCDAEHGYSYSPTVHGDLVIISIESNDEPGTFAYEKKTGKLRWKVPGDPIAASYASPIVIQNGKREELVISANDKTRALDPATGKLIWICDGPTKYVVANPVFGGGILFVNGGYPERTMMALRPGGEGDITATNVLWKHHKQRTYVPGPVYANGAFFVSNDEGITTCIDPATGAYKWQERANSGRTRASLLMAEENLYTINDEGKAVVYKADPEKYVEVAKNELGPEDVCYASPAISGGKLYIRTGTTLYCLGKK